MSLIKATASLSDAQFDRIVGIAAAEAGLSIPHSKKSLVQSRVTRRMRKIGIERCDDYVRRLDDDVSERHELTCVLTTNVSHFYREKHHFDIISNSILASAGDSPLRFWSAGCSNGQEPYTLAYEILKVFPDASDRDILILATDIDPQVLAKAATGIYNQTDIEGVPLNDRKLFFQDRRDGTVAVRPELASLIRFRQLNLNAAWPMRALFDVILCRNVVIYFNDQTQRELWPRFASQLRRHGLLMLGHSERVHPLAGSGFENTDVTTYRKL